jgi:hypothetical protein
MDQDDDGVVELTVVHDGFLPGSSILLAVVRPHRILGAPRTRDDERLGQGVR